MFKISAIVPLVLVLLLLTTARADATVLLLSSPQINFKSSVDKKLKEAIEAVITDKHYQFLGGGLTMGWGPENDCSSLVYGGDTNALTEFILSLNRIEGLKVKITQVSSITSSLILDAPENLAAEYLGRKPMSKPVPSWELSHYKLKSDSVEVHINTSAKDISVDTLLADLAKRAASADKKSKP